MRPRVSLAALVLFVALPMTPAPTATPAATRAQAALPNLFFAFDNGVGRGTWTPKQQAETLKALGYAGIGYTGTADLPERVKAFGSQGLAIVSLYVPCRPGTRDRCPPRLEETLKRLEGTRTLLWLTVSGKTNDDEAATAVREIADKAGKYGVKVALYPHYGFHVATTADALRLVKKVGRKNVGVSINLCHELRSGNGAKLGEIVKSAAAKLLLVSINGADPAGGWNRLIQPLGQGAFDVRGFLATLHQAGYTGPIGLQCYNVRGDPRENLKKSMEAWKTLRRSAAGK